LLTFDKKKNHGKENKSQQPRGGTGR